MTSRFISFESGEGAGKTTQIHLLSEALTRTGQKVVVTREPGGTPLAERIRGQLLSGLFRSAGPDVEATLFAAARADHVNRVIRPALARGEWVLTDRFYDSTRVYQTLCGASADVITALEDEACGDCRPDLTLVLDIDDDVAFQRAATRRGADAADRFEGEGLIFHRKVRQAFLDIVDHDPKRCAKIDASGSIKDVSIRIFDTVMDRLGSSSRLSIAGC